MAAHAHIRPPRPRARSTWLAAAIGSGLTAAWAFAPQTRILLLAAAIVAGVAMIQRLDEPRPPAPGRAPAPIAADPVSLLAEHGIRELEAYLARHLAFAAYLERRDADARATAEPPAG